MPLNIVICDCSRKFLVGMADVIQKIFANKKYDARVKFVCLTPERIISEMPYSNERHLFIIEMKQEKADVYNKVRQMFKDSYICFTTKEENIEAMKFFINLNLRPSGVIVKPPNLYEMAEVIGRIYSDFDNEFNMDMDYITVNVGFDIHKILLSDIVYFESVAKKVEIFTQGKRISYYASLQQLEDRLGDSFVRCHRSFLVNIKKIKSIMFSNMLVVMDNGANLSISRTYKNRLKEIWGKEG